MIKQFNEKEHAFTACSQNKNYNIKHIKIKKDFNIIRLLSLSMVLLLEVGL